MTIPSSELSLWQGSASSLSILNASVTQGFVQPRFFIPTNILISQYGIVGMIIADNCPGRRHVSYSDDEWTGVSESEDQGFAPDIDPARRAHFEKTNEGFSLIRAFALPKVIREVFSRDKFLGEPMIEKCIDEETIPEEFDEMKLGQGHDPALSAADLIKSMAAAGWQATKMAATVPEPQFEGNYLRARISFHGWFAFQQAVETAQAALAAALGNFDEFLSRLDPAKRPAKLLQLE